MMMTAIVETEIHKYIENSGWTGVATRGIPHRTHWIFEPVGAETRFTYILEYRLPIPLLGRLLEVLFLERQWQRILDGSLQNLKTHFSPPD